MRGDSVSSGLIPQLACSSTHPVVRSMQEALRLATILVGSWSEASPGELAHAPTEACASTLEHVLGSMQCLLACLEPAQQVTPCKLTSRGGGFPCQLGVVTC